MSEDFMDMFNRAIHDRSHYVDKDDYVQAQAVNLESISDSVRKLREIEDGN